MSPEQEQHLFESLGGINAKLDVIKESFAKHVKDDEALAARVSVVEDRQKKVKWMAAGAGAVITGLGWLVETVFATRH